MNNDRRVTHVIKLERSTKIILAAGVVVLALQAFVPALSIREAMAQTMTLLTGSLNVRLSGEVGCSYGCVR
jgi:hypothetical protein